MDLHVSLRSPSPPPLPPKHENDAPLAPRIPDLPLEVLGNIASLLAPPYYPPDPITPSDHIAHLDPYPPRPLSTANHIALACRASHALLEASRPWLWEHLDVRSGRGWLAIVNALTEEVLDEDDELGSGSGAGTGTTTTPGGSGFARVVPKLPAPRTAPAPAQRAMPTRSVAVGVMNPESREMEQVHVPVFTPLGQANADANIVPGMDGYFDHQPMADYHPLHAAAITFAQPGPSILNHAHPPAQIYASSPPQPERLSLLLTPQVSREATPRTHAPILLPPRASPDLSGPGPGTAGTLQKASARLRGRSRSPRRSVGFVTEGIDAILQRDRSTSSHRGEGGAGGTWPRRPSFGSRPSLGRQTSLSWSHTREDVSESEDELSHEKSEGKGKERADGEFLQLDGLGRIRTPPRLESPAMTPQASSHGTMQGADMMDVDEIEEEQWLNCNPELLPPPGPYIRHISFTNFRTIGSRRTQDEAVRGRFVTAGRLEGVIKNAPNLVTVCMTEYVDSALSYEVLEELLFRGTKRPRNARRLSEARGTSLSRVRSISVPPPPVSQIDQLDPPRPVYAPYEDETDDEKWKRRGVFTPIEALDLTGCVSVTFQRAVTEFWQTYYAADARLAPKEDPEARGRSRSRARADSGEAPSATETETEAETDDERRLPERSTSRRRAPVFPALRRLSLRNCSLIESDVLEGMLKSFTALTHLDLSGTKVPSRFLASLIDKCPRSLRLQSLSLARCPRLDPYVLVEFLVRSPAASELKELNLYVHPSQGNPIRSAELLRLITTAPCFKSGQLRYLDISSAELTAEHLAVGVFPPQPRLVCLGLSHIPLLSLEPISDFILRQAPNVEILTLIGTAFETQLRPTNSALQLTLQLHSKLINPCTTAPFSLSGLNLSAPDPHAPKDPGPTRLRVIELAGSIRRAIGPAGGSHMWKNIRSKGGRGWYVDVTAAWVQDVTPEERRWRFARYLPHTNPWRMWLQGLSDANGRVSSSVGWHSRKMEVVQGWGMMGREEGLAGAGAFAYEEG